jgi:hypothetical protein
MTLTVHLLFFAATCFGRTTTITTMSLGKVYSEVVSPSNKCCLMMARVRPKHVAAMNKEYT